MKIWNKKSLKKVKAENAKAGLQLNIKKKKKKKKRLLRNYPTFKVNIEEKKFLNISRFSDKSPLLLNTTQNCFTDNMIQ